MLKHYLIAWKRAIDNTTMALNIAGTILIMVIMVIVNMDVIGRGLFDAPLKGVPEILSMSIVAIVFLQISDAFRAGRVTRSDTLLDFLAKKNARLKHFFIFLFCVLSNFIMSVLLLHSWKFFVKAWDKNTFVGTIGVFEFPIWPVKLIIVVGCVMLIIQIAILAMESLYHSFIAKKDVK